MAFLRQEARVVERFRIIEVAEAELPTFEREGHGTTLRAKGEVLRPTPEALPGNLLEAARLSSPEGEGWRVMAEGRSLS